MVYLPTIGWCIMVNVYIPYMDGMGYKLVIYTAHELLVQLLVRQNLRTPCQFARTSASGNPEATHQG